MFFYTYANDDGSDLCSTGQEGTLERLDPREREHQTDAPKGHYLTTPSGKKAWECNHYDPVIFNTKNPKNIRLRSTGKQPEDMIIALMAKLGHIKRVPKGGRMETEKYECKLPHNKLVEIQDRIIHILHHVVNWDFDAAWKILKTSKKEATLYMDQEWFLVRKHDWMRLFPDNNWWPTELDPRTGKTLICPPHRTPLPEERELAETTPQADGVLKT